MKERPQTMIGRRGEGLGRGPGALSGKRQGLEAVAKGIGEGVAKARYRVCTGAVGYREQGAEGIERFRGDFKLEARFVMGEGPGAVLHVAILGARRCPG